MKVILLLTTFDMKMMLVNKECINEHFSLISPIF